MVCVCSKGLCTDTDAVVTSTNQATLQMQDGVYWAILVEVKSDCTQLCRTPRLWPRLSLVGQFRVILIIQMEKLQRSSSPVAVDGNRCGDPPLDSGQRVRDFSTLSSEVDIFVQTLPTRHSALCRRGGNKSERDRGGGWLQGNRIFQTHQDWCTFKLMHKTCTGPKQTTFLSGEG